VIAKSNAEQVSKIIRIAKELGFKPATPNEARKILNLKGLERLTFNNWVIVEHAVSKY